MNDEPMTGRLLLPPDVELIPVSELAQEDRELLTDFRDKFAVTRPLSRSGSTIIDRDAASLLSRFRSPVTIVDAVIAQSRADAIDPQRLLREALPLLCDYVDDRILVPADAQEARKIRPRLGAGVKIESLTILGCVQTLEDCELHQARAPDGSLAALKIARPAHAARLNEVFARESSVLQRLAGLHTPELLCSGSWNGAPYIATTWIDGVTADTAASEIRESGRPSARRDLVALCARIAEAYAAIHGAHIIHGDVHERNILVRADGSVVLVDFGLARCDDGSLTHDTWHRGGIFPYFEPEYAQAVVANRRPPQANALGEQYILAALLFRLVTGHAHIPPTLEVERTLEQLAHTAPIPFSRVGLSSWPALESILTRALSRSPHERFASTADFQRGLQRLAEKVDQAGHSAALTTHQRRIQQVTESAIFSSVTRGSRKAEVGLTEEPFSTVNSGAAGVAYALYRLSMLRNDADLLTQADAWGTRAVREIRRRGAVYPRDGTITRKNVGSVALYHTITGVHCVRALIAQAMNDMATARDSVDRFVTAAEKSCVALDLTTGRAGIALGCALILHAAPPEIPVIRDNLIALGDRTVGRLAATLDRPIAKLRAYRTLGMAHGWAGYLYALLRWDLLRHRMPSDVQVQQLHELADLGVRRGRGMQWPWKAPSAHAKREPAVFASWCNGSAGFVHLWIIARQATGDERFAQLAERAAWHTWEHADYEATDLCCGMAGRAYALLATYRVTGERRWLDLAWRLFERAAGRINSQHAASHALYKGDLGVALLAAELVKPEWARMPLFEDEGWMT